MQERNIEIHEFDQAKLPHHFDDEGQQMIGFYYRFVDGNDLPLGALIGPYRYNGAAEKAALKAFRLKDF
jgi:hypothetical protein